MATCMRPSHSFLFLGAAMFAFFVLEFHLKFDVSSRSKTASGEVDFTQEAGEQGGRPRARPREPLAGVGGSVQCRRLFMSFHLESLVLQRDAFMFQDYWDFRKAILLSSFLDGGLQSQNPRLSLREIVSAKDVRLFNVAQYQPWLGCQMHEYRLKEIRQCVRNRRQKGLSTKVFFLGDSRIREIHYSFWNLIKSTPGGLDLVNSHIHKKKYDDESLTFKDDSSMNLTYIFCAYFSSLPEDIGYTYVAGDRRKSRRLTDVLQLLQSDTDWPDLILFSISRWYKLFIDMDTLLPYDKLMEEASKALPVVQKVTRKIRQLGGLTILLLDGLKEVTCLCGTLNFLLRLPTSRTVSSF